MACGSALAIDPCAKEPNSLRLPFIFRYRAAQIVGVPTSQEKMASSAGTLVEHLGDILRMDRFLPGFSRRQIIKPLAGCLQ